VEAEKTKLVQYMSKLTEIVKLDELVKEKKMTKLARLSKLPEMFRTDWDWEEAQTTKPVYLSKLT